MWNDLSDVFEFLSRVAAHLVVAGLLIFTIAPMIISRVIEPARLTPGAKKQPSGIVPYPISAARRR
jgi:hypothetical protein